MARGKHTHTGECQVCGAHQAISNDDRHWIAKHGYSVDHGFFNGTCWGSDAQPLELSKDLLDEAIRRVEVQCESERKSHANVEAMAGTTKGWHTIPVPKDDPLYRITHERTLFGEFFEVFTPYAHQEKPDDGYNKVMFRSDSRYDGDKEGGKEYDPSKQGYHYRDALDAGKVTQERELRNIADRIADMTRYIKWQIERKKKWKVQKLQPVKHEPPRPVFEKGMTVELPGRDIRYVLTKAKHALSWGGTGRNPRVVGWFAEAEDDNARWFYLTNKDLKNAKVISKAKQ